MNDDAATSARREHVLALLDGHKSFTPDLPGFQHVWDATCLSLFQRCPRRYQYEMIEGYAPGTAIDLDFGIIYHAALERYTHDRTDGFSHDDAVLRAVQFAATTAIERHEEPADEGAPAWSEWSHATDAKNRRTLIRTIVWYLDQWERDPAEVDMLSTGRPAVELSFILDFGWSTPRHSIPIYICGTIDRRVNFLGSLYEMDRKTTKSTVNPRYFDRYTPNNQVSLYTTAGKMITAEASRGMIIDVAQTAKGFSNFARAEIPRTPNMLDEWREDAIFWISFAEQCAERLHWPMNPESCWNCPFHKDVCSKDPSIRPIYLRDMARRRWDPAARHGAKQETAQPPMNFDVPAQETAP